MRQTDKPQITVQTTINAPIEKVWAYFTKAEHVCKWNQASADWHCPKAVNDLREGGKFCYTMAAKDGSMEFDFSGTFTKVEEPTTLSYLLDDNRGVTINFQQNENDVLLTETFEAESENSLELQEYGWGCILESFRVYVERE